MEKPIITTTTTSSNNSTDNQTHHDFMNVDSFSQLPFIRPATTAKSSSSSAIRLFGIDFSSTTETSGDSGESTTITGKPDPETNPDTATATENGSRKFECHYCCRNFPTSQALGGHQNAHKRERQHAKRAHLDHHHLYGGPHRPPPNPNYLLYPSSSSSSTPSYSNYSRFSNYNYNYNNSNNTYTNYNNNNSTLNHQQPHPTINGSPLAVWRVPPGIHRDRTSRLFSGSGGIDRSTPRSAGSGSFISSMGVMGNSSTSNSNAIAGFDHHGEQFKRAANGRDNVSLDLHL